MKGPRLIVRAILVEEGRLLVNEHEDRLALFGGRVEKGETAKRALARELAEELGVRVEVGPLAFVIENFYRGKKRVHELGLYYRVRPLRTLGPTVEAREPVLRPRWLPIAEIETSSLMPKILRERLNFTDGVTELVEIDRVAFPEVL